MPLMLNPVSTTASQSAATRRMFVVSLLFWVFLLPIQVHSEPASRPTKADQVEWITKSEAKQFVRESYYSDQQSNSDPLEHELKECFFDHLMDDVFEKNNRLSSQEFKRKLSGFLDKNNEISQRGEIILFRCMTASKEVRKRLSQNTQEQRSRSNAASAPLLDLDDLRLDASELDGKPVRVRGVGQYVMDTLTLRKSTTDMSPVFIDLKNLPREQRKEIINRCSNIMEGCRLTVYGTVKAPRRMKSIVAEQIMW